MSWFQDKEELGFIHTLCFKVLKTGDVPQHVAIIMDGNRRFARKHGVEKKEGHSKGFEKLAEVLLWCFELGIPEVTVYAFSTENFKRSQEEVDGLMKLAKEKFDKLMEERDMIEKYGVCVRILGDVNQLPEEVKLSIARVVDFTRNNSKSILNVAMAYSSRHEITETIRDISIGVKEGSIRKSDINELLLEKCLFTNKCRDVDLLIRTSGEVRLSDFLMWQSSYSMLSFVDDLWPEFTIWQFMKCILSYQLGYDVLKDTRATMKLRQSRAVIAQDMDNAHAIMLARLREEGLSQPERNISQKKLNEEVRKYSKQREERVDLFLRNLDCQRSSYITDAKLANLI